MLRKLINQMIYDICCPRCANDQKAKIQDDFYINVVGPFINGEVERINYKW